MLTQTNATLQSRTERELTVHELWRYIGLRIAMTAYPQTPVHDFWIITPMKLKPAHNFGQFGISKRRCDAITSALTFWTVSNASDDLHCVRELINSFDINMTAAFKLAWIICIDESMSQWTNRNTLPNWVYVES